MLKYYLVNGKQYQYREGEQPAGAVELVEKKPEPKPEPVAEVKAEKPRSKMRKVANK